MHTSTRKQLGKNDIFDKEKAIAMCNSKWQPTLKGQMGEVVDVFMVISSLLADQLLFT